jgi:FtsP/CotA-like multicopper oxidase with cupredoxin domain
MEYRFMHLDRRRFLQTAGAALAMAPLASARGASPPPTILTAEKRVIEVLGKPAPVLGLRSSSGRSGFSGRASQPFDVILENRLDERTLIHWHGQTPPVKQDGMPMFSQSLLQPGERHAYRFKARPGTHWMHSHHALQEQRLLAAPLIVAEDDSEDVQEVVIMLHDFTFKAPDEILASLTGGSGGGHGMHGTVRSGGMNFASIVSHLSGMFGGPGHLHDVEYDAFLANDRTLEDPEIVPVEADQRVRLRIINGAASTAFIIDVGQLEGEVVAVDGNPVQALRARTFPLAMAQRVDVIVRVPNSPHAWPVLAWREGGSERTGIVLAPRGSRVAKISRTGDAEAAVAGLGLETKLRAIHPLSSRPVDRKVKLTLGGGTGYHWTINGGQPVKVTSGERVEMTIRNRTMMMHPIHLHGHHFQVVNIDGASLQGAVRDTVLVPAHGGEVTVVFDADNPGEWMLHCHNLYHMEAGMMTTMAYT